MNRTKKTWTEEIDEKLLLAVIEGDLEQVKFYAGKGADLLQIDAEGRKNPLRLATIRSNMDIVKYLVEECMVKPKDDIRVLHMATMASKLPKEMFQYHVAHGADINQIDPTLGTPLMVTIHQDGGDFAMAKWIVEQGADVNTRCGQGAALHNTVEYGNRDLLDYLMEHGAQASLDATDGRGLTPLMLAASIGRDEMVQALIEDYKVDVNQQIEVTPLLMAVQHRRVGTVRLLLKLGADPNLQHTGMHCSPMHLAASNEFLSIIDELMEAGADIDVEDPRGYTPLLMAGTEGYTEVVAKLLEHGADVNKRAHSDNCTPIWHCANKNRVGVVKLLLEYGAQPNTTLTEKEETIEELARSEGRDKMANLLHYWFIAEGQEEKDKMCDVCCKYELGEMKRCTRCKVAWYCSVDCQRKAWPTHKTNCKAPQ